MHRESSIEGPCVEMLHRYGWDVPKVGTAGWPDRIALKKNVFVWLEFKTANGRLTPAQKRRIPRLEARGQVVLVIDSVNDLEELLDRGYYPFTRGG